MDIADIGTTKDTAEITLYDPRTGATLKNADGSDMTITAYSTESPQVRAVTREQQDRRMARVAKVGRAALSSTEIEQNQLETLIASVKTWNITLDKKQPEPTKKNIEDLFTKYTWLRAQYEEGFYNSSNFLQG